ncbi:DUF4376 domain-containing protein [Pseudomonas helleri]|uniref:DUF4376 domain-containing protein n=1 Tax=Pseudomonas helleri TaxID=1608996 RepID=UPI003F9C1BF5
MNIYQIDMSGYWSGAVNAINEGQGAPVSWVLSPPPELGAGEYALWSGRWSVTSVPPAPDWPALIATRRWQVETGGTTVAGVQVNTERDSQALLTGAAFAATLDPAYHIKWKAATGFVDLTGEQVIGLASQARAFVQACFNREAVLLGAVADGSITAEMLEEGWPA